MPSVDSSKVARHKSGAAPERVQVTFVRLTERFCKAAMLFESRAMCLAVALDSYRSDGPIRIRVKACIGRTISIEPRDLVARVPADAGENATDQDFAVGLQANSKNVIVRARVKAGVQRTSGIDSRDVIARRATDAGEAAAH